MAFVFDLQVLVETTSLLDVFGFFPTPNGRFYFLLPALPGLRLVEVGRSW